MLTRDMSQHNVATDAGQTSVIQRTPAPYFAPPRAAGMREPGTDWTTIWSAPTPPAGMSNPRTSGQRIVFRPKTPQMPWG